MFNPFSFIFVILELKFFLSVAHWGHEAKHKFSKKMLHIKGVHIGVQPVYTKNLSLRLFKYQTAWLPI